MAPPARETTERDRLRSRLLPALAAFLIRLLRRSLRLRVHGRERVESYAAEGQRYIHVFWHAHILTMIYSYVGPGLVFMISRHRDGELIARTVERFGYITARGSTTAGGSAALREMIRAVRHGHDIGFTPDGPRGPARRVQPGCIAAAQLLGIPIVPIAAGADRAWLFNSWDRFMVPKPGAHVLLAYGEPLSISREESIQSASRRLEQALLELEAFAVREAAHRATGKAVR